MVEGRSRDLGGLLAGNCRVLVVVVGVTVLDEGKALVGVFGRPAVVEDLRGVGVPLKVALGSVGVGHSLAAGGLGAVGELGTTTGIAYQVEAVVVQLTDNQELLVVVGGHKAEDIALEGGVEDFQLGLEGTAALLTLGSVNQLAEVVGAIHLGEAFACGTGDSLLAGTEVIAYGHLVLIGGDGRWTCSVDSHYICHRAEVDGAYSGLVVAAAVALGNVLNGDWTSVTHC